MMVCGKQKNKCDLPWHFHRQRSGRWSSRHRPPSCRRSSCGGTPCTWGKLPTGDHRSRLAWTSGYRVSSEQKLSQCLFKQHFSRLSVVLQMGLSKVYSSLSSFVRKLFENLKAHSDELRLIHTAVEDSCVSAEMEHFLIFCTATFHCSHMLPTQHIWMSLKCFKL